MNKQIPPGYKSPDTLQLDDEGRSVEVITETGEVLDAYFRFWPNGKQRWRDANNQDRELDVEVVGWRETGAGG